MFPLKKREVSGYEFMEKTFYSAHHLGTDYRANFDDLYMPFKGEVIRINATQGGLTAWIYPFNQNVVIRMMHLSELKKGNFDEGELIGKTGNSGSATTAPHLHIDISKGSVDLNNLNNFIDPESFDWGQEAQMTAGDQKANFKKLSPRDQHFMAVYWAYLSIKRKEPTDAKVWELVDKYPDIQELRKVLLGEMCDKESSCDCEAMQNQIDAEKSLRNICEEALKIKPKEIEVCNKKPATFLEKIKFLFS